MEHRPATTTPLSADDVKAMLRAYTGTHVVIEDWGHRQHIVVETRSRFALLITPPRVVIRPDTRVDRQLEREHPGGLASFEKEAVYAMVEKDSPSAIIADTLVKPGDFEAVPYTAGELLQILRQYEHPNLGVIEFDGEYYGLQMRPDPLVFVWENSPLFPDLRKLHQQDLERRRKS